MNVSFLLEQQPWRDVQSAWRALPRVTETAGTEYSQAWWQNWRLLLETHLLALQPLVLAGALGADTLEMLRRLFNLRLERVLDRYLQQTRPLLLRTYYLTPDPYLRPAYHRYHAFQELEQRLLLLRQEPFWSPLLSSSLSQRVLEDLNLELLEILAAQLGPTREAFWPEILDLLIVLEVQAPASEAVLPQLLQKHAGIDSLAVAEEILQHSRFPVALKAALFFLVQSGELGASLPALARLLHTSGQHSLRAQAVQLLGQFPAPASADLLATLLRDPTPDTQPADGIFAEVRLAALAALREVYRAFPEYWSQAVVLLQSGIHTPAWGPAARLTAVRMLAEQGMGDYLELVLQELKLALVQDHHREITLALQALQTMGDTRAIPVLLEMLQQSFRPDTALERFRQAFHADRQALQEQIQTTLKALGQPVRFNSQRQRWETYFSL